MSDVTQILQKIERGDPDAAERLLPLLYEELKKLAAAKMLGERPDHTLQATALVHEAYMRLVDAQQVQRWDSRGHFFSAAAEAMRRILIESARRKNSRKRGGDQRRLTADALDVAATTAGDPDLLLDIDAGLTRLAEEDPEAAELVKLRLFAGLSLSEAGEMLDMSRSINTGSRPCLPTAAPLGRMHRSEDAHDSPARRARHRRLPRRAKTDIRPYALRKTA